MTDQALDTTAQLVSDRMRISFAAGHGSRGSGVTYAIEVKEHDSWQPLHPEPFAQQWIALRAGKASPVTLAPAWAPGEEATNFVAFHTDIRDGGHDVFAAGERIDLPLVVVEQVGPNEVRCRTADGQLTVSWSLADFGAEVGFVFLPPSDGYWSVGFQAFTGLPEDDVRAIFAGPFINERRFPVVAGVLPEGSLSAPFALVETGPAAEPVTFALGVHPDEGGWAWQEIPLARYAIGARDEMGRIRPQVFAPVLGNEGSHRKAGEAIRFRLFLHAARGSWWESYRDIVTEVYGIRSYRENIYGSLTDAVHNMVDLLKDETYSGWMERGRGLLNIEHRDGVKLASPGAVLSAGLVTSDHELLRTRGQPILEYSISRGHYGFTWEVGSTTVGQEHVRQAFEDLGGPAWDAPVLIALHQLARGYTPALGQLARAQADGIDDFYIRRSDFQVSLSLYYLTGERRYLERACAQADTYITERIDTPATDPVEGQRFLIHFGSDWMSLLDLWEETKEPRFLAAAEAGARWFATLLWVQPLPPDDVLAEPMPTAPTEEVFRRTTAFHRHMFDDHSGQSSWVRDAIPYPRGVNEVPQETAPGWATSVVGMSFETWSTYRGRMVQNPGWAAYLLRLAQATGDEFFRDLAENSIVGRFTNYPGYYFYVPTVAPLQPDFPYLGPMDLTSIYYHHIPPQIGLALDFLVEQARDRSGGRITFPVVRDDSYVQFRHHLPGHAPGRFFDLTDAWLWMPRGVVDVGSHLVNWVSVAAGDGTHFGVALSNSTRRSIRTTVTLDRQRLGLRADDAPAVTVVDATGRPTSTIALGDGPIEVTIPARGLSAIVMDGVRIDEPLHRYGHAGPDGDSAFVTLAQDDPHLGTVRAVVVATGPDDPAVYAFTTLKPDQASRFVLSYERGGETVEASCDRFPFEVSVPLTEAPFRFRIAVIDHAGQRHETEDATLSADSSWRPDRANGEPG